MSSLSGIPSYSDLLWPTLRVVREIGDSGTIGEIVERVIESEDFTDEQQSVLHGDGPRTEIEYRLAWARTYLKGMGALENSERGVWSTTELGRAMTPEDVVARHAAYTAQLREGGEPGGWRERRRDSPKTSRFSATGRSACWGCC